MWLRKQHFGLFAALALALVIGCNKKNPIERYGVGAVREVIVVYDDDLTDVGYNLAMYLAADTFYTPHPEPLMFVESATSKEFQESFRGARNSVILAVKGGEAEKILKEAFGRKLRFGIQSKAQALPEGGFVIGVYMPTPESLRNFMATNGKKVKELLLARFYEVYRRMAFLAGKRKDIPKELWERYGFTFDIPNGFAYTAIDSHFVAFAKHYPDRFIFIFWDDTTRTLDPDSIVALRDSLTEKYYEGDYVLKGYWRAEQDTFLGYQAVKITGAWQNDRRIMGGPFRLYAFNRKGRFYMVDLGVYYPEEIYKFGYIMRLEVIARTLRFRD